MAAETSAQLNIRFSVMPDELLGKRNPRFLKDGKRYTASKLLSAAFLHTRFSVLGYDCKTTYKDVNDELGYARSTIARNFAELTDDEDGIFKRDGQSKYVPSVKVSSAHGLPIYHFLLEQGYNGKRLTGDDVLYLSMIIRFYDNKSRTQKYFVGGEKRVAGALNKKSYGTAHAVVHRLIDAKYILSFILHDGKLSEKPGMGFNGDYQTVYVLTDKLKKRLQAVKDEQKRLKDEKEAIKAITGINKKKKEIIAPTAEETAYTEDERAEAIAKAFRSDITFKNYKQKYIKLSGELITATMQNGGQDTAETLELGRQLGSIMSDVLNYLLSHNIKRTYIPDDWEAFIRTVLRS